MSGFAGIVRVLTTDDPALLGAHGRLIEARFGVTTRTLCIPDQPTGIYDVESERLAVPKIIQIGKVLAADGASAIVISCAADPAVTELRRELTIPVIGPGSSAAALAVGLADRVGVLNLTEGAPGPVRRILGDRCIGEDSPEGVRNSLDLLTDWGREATLRAAKQLADAGAGALVLACTGYATIGMADELRRRLGVLAVDPVIAAGLMVWFALSQPSRLTSELRGVS